MRAPRTASGIRFFVSKQRNTHLGRRSRAPPSVCSLDLCSGRGRRWAGQVLSASLREDYALKLKSSPSECVQREGKVLSSCRFPASGGVRAQLHPPLLHHLLLLFLLHPQRGVAQCSRRDRDGGGGIRELRGLAASARDRAGE